MAWKSGHGKAPEQCPEGPRVLAYVPGSGRIVRGDYQGQISARFMLDFEAEPGGDNVLDAKGNPFKLRSWLSAAIRPKTTAGKLIVTARGRELDENEMGEETEAPAPKVEVALPAPVESLFVGLRFLCMVTHNEQGYARWHIDSVTKAPQREDNEGW